MSPQVIGGIIYQNNEKKWSIDRDECILCKSNEFPHAGRGMCRQCYIEFIAHQSPRRKFRKLKKLIIMLLDQYKGGRNTVDILEELKREIENY